MPGLVVSLHVVGSATLGDYQPGRSDLDTWAELDRRADADELAALAGAHQNHPVETVYLVRGALAGGPATLDWASWVRDGQAYTEPSDQWHAVTRLQLAAYRATVRGDVPEDVPAAREFCRDNLIRYWRPLLASVREMLAARGPDHPARAEGAIHIGLGPPRLWHTIRTGEIIGKSRAGELAAEHWPDLADRLGDLLAARRGETVALTTRHGAAGIELFDRILDAVS